MRIDFKDISVILALILSCGLIYFSLVWRTPEMAAYRWLAGGLFVAITFLLITGQYIAFRRSANASGRVAHVLKIGIALTCAALLGFLVSEFHFQWQRYKVLSADPAMLSRLGRHFVVGYRSTGFADELISRNGVAGLFITAHNVHGLDAAEIQSTIGHFQSQRQAKGGKPLWIATDQEGGRVSRMTPPLAAQPSLGEVVTQHLNDGTLESVIHSYGRTQGKSLAALGINLNFSPVVDINYNIVNQEDRYTRIYQRAISSDPKQVRRVAGWYCDALFESGVRCTLKHFPGLGKVQTDTHLDSARLTETAQALVESDWIPFRALMSTGNHPFTMLSHVQLETVDATQPVSTSKLVVDKLLRKEWRYEGILITDDFSMAAISQRQGGIGAATVEALNAGVDLILISFDPEQYYPAMYALLKAERDGKLSLEMLEQSEQRLDSIAMPSAL